MTHESLEERSFALPDLGAQGVRFIIVGIAATMTHVLTAVLLMDGLGFSLAGIANAIALLAGSTVSYLGNYFWTFGNGGRHLTRVARFVAAYGAVFFLNGVVMFGVADLAGIPYLIPLAIIVVVTPIATFLLNRFWVFV